MGAWGYGIMQNDTTVDIVEEFKGHYNDGLSPKEIRVLLEKEYGPDGDDEYYSEIWTGIAYGQWICGGLEAGTLKKLQSIVKQQKGLEVKRIKAIADFIEKLKTPKAKPLARKKIVARGAYFNTGDIITIELDNGLKTAAIVESSYTGKTHGENTLVFIDLMQKEISKADVLKADIMYLDRPGEDKYYRGYFHAIFSARNMSRQIKRASRIGEINLKKTLMLGGIPIGFWEKISGLYMEQNEFLKKSKSERPVKVTVQDFLKADEALCLQLVKWSNKIFMDK